MPTLTTMPANANTPHVKAQWVRLLDVIAIGPLMAYGGLRLHKEEPVVGYGLMVLGVLTVLYNGRNLLKIEHDRRSGSLLANYTPTSPHMLPATPGVSQSELDAAATAAPVHLSN